MIGRASEEGRLARRQALPFVYVGVAGLAINASAPDNLGALTSWPFLTGAVVAVAGVAFMTAWTRELPASLAPMPALGGMLSIALIAAATGGDRSGAIALVLLPLMWFGYAAVGRQVALGVAWFVGVLAAVSYLAAPSGDPLSNWDHSATLLLVGLGVTYGTSRIANERRALIQALRDSAHTDPLTGLLNRRGWEHAAAAAFARAQRDRLAVAVLVLDLDGFKQLNDSHGHAAGDAMLVETADAWRSALRAGDLLGRSGGDEFFLLLVGIDRPRAADVAERLRAATPFPVSCSVGIALGLAAGNELDGLVIAADSALYAAKATGRDRVVFASRSTAGASDARRDAAVSVPEADTAALGAFESLLADAGVIRFSALGDRFVAVTPEVQSVLGWQPEELLAATFAELLHPEDREATLAEAARVWFPGSVVDGFESRLRCRDGRYRRLRFHARSDGTIWRAVAVDLGPADDLQRAPVAA